MAERIQNITEAERTSIYQKPPEIIESLGRPPLAMLYYPGNEGLNNHLSAVLPKNGVNIVLASDASVAAFTLRNYRPDLVFVGSHNLHEYQEIGETSYICPPVSVLSSRIERDRYMQEVGYISDVVEPPFDARELAAKVRTIVRRTTPALPEGILIENTLVLPSERTAIKGEDEYSEPVELKDKEWEVLIQLIVARDRVAHRREIFVKVWDEWSVERSVDVHINKLRKKLGYDAIKTVWGFGYMLNYQSVDFAQNSQQNQSGGVELLHTV